MTRSKLLMTLSFALVFVLFSARAALAEPLSKREWREQTTAICTAADDEVYSIAVEELGFLSEGEQPTPEELEGFAARVVPALEQSVEDVVDLEEPNAFKKNVKRWAAAVREVLAEIESDPTFLLDTESDPFAKPRTIAKKLGLRGCSGGAQS